MYEKIKAVVKTIVIGSLVIVGIAAALAVTFMIAWGIQTLPDIYPTVAVWVMVVLSVCWVVGILAQVLYRDMEAERILTKEERKQSVEE